jgi:AcrR family transcriptional regulator
MQENNGLSTDLAILNAAKKIFSQKGLKASTMQEIANEAGVNKALLHYYYRKKENLYLAVFSEMMKTNLPNMVHIIAVRRPIREMVKHFVSAYIDMLSTNEYLSNFLVMEIQQNPERIIEVLSKTQPERIFRIVGQRLRREGIYHIRAEHLMMNMVSLCFFPFIIRPLLNGVLFRNNGKTEQQFLEERKQVVSDFIINALKK